MFFFLIQVENYNAAVRIGTSFISNLGMGWGCVEFANYESINVGIQWSNIGSPVNADSSFTMLHVYIIFILDSIIYGVLAWYLDLVLPGDYGIPLPWYFPFTVSIQEMLQQLVRTCHTRNLTGAERMWTKSMTTPMMFWITASFLRSTL